MNKKAIIVSRIMGGLGNQLFCYAAARRLSLSLNAELAIDDYSGFIRDRTYRRTYQLDTFSIPCRKASRRERLEPFERSRRALAKVVSRVKPIDDRAYLEEQSQGFDPRLLKLRLLPRRYLDGLWQDERFFDDVESQIRQDLCFRQCLKDTCDGRIIAEIGRFEPVAVHIRWFDRPREIKSVRNLDVEYYRDAFLRIEEMVSNPRYFLFSDDLPAAIALVKSIGRSDCKTMYFDSKCSIKDFYAMSRCTHFVTANSTYSWWAAWLARPRGGVILMPNRSTNMRGALVWQGAGSWTRSSYA